MNNIHLNIIGSNTFSNLLEELEFINILDFKRSILDYKKKSIVKILFPENLKVKDVKEYLLENGPIILFLNNKDYLKKNNLIVLDFHVVLKLPIEIISFREILNILLTKYNFFQKSKIMVDNYEIDSNQRTINGLDKSFLLKNIWKHTLDLDTHVFETHLYRLRKKIYSSFKDENFIIEKKSLYYLKN
jgi:hypothetical protein